MSLLSIDNTRIIMYALCAKIIIPVFVRTKYLIIYVKLKAMEMYLK